MNYGIVVEIRGLTGLADPEGLAIERALPSLGFAGVEGVHVGKVFRFSVDAPSAAEARRTAQEMCDRLLANPVIERAEIRVLDDPPESST
ncbi:MAG TPA: phosphoribosylformylglycinamidine synthase subunit PurS [Acidimicrobiales bacterium]|nr:phosphoribosylformylglycinamidine synthase subunit PurS [Acidimicrobiales bacterium]